MLPATARETESTSLVPDQICRRFSLDEIRSATQDFNEALVIGQGGFGKVYKGHIKNGPTTVVAIKRLHSMSNQGAPEFRAEVEMLSKLRHCNLVSLIGYCNAGIEMVLVYEYMPHGTLEDRLHKASAPLSWLQRIKICIGAARGLDYLHTGTGTQHGVIHRDVKSSNVLLDENFAAKISDFGLAKVGPTNQTRTYVSTGVKGTFGYMDPCYFFTGKLTRKSDVYSFGVIMLEVLCGRPAVDTSLDEEQWGLATWAQDRIKEGKLNQIIDSRLSGQISSNCLKDFARIACRCLDSHPNQRPTMAEIIARLEVILSVQERRDSSVTEGKFIDKIWSFFSAKVQSKSSNLMSARTSDSGGEPSDKEGNKLNNAMVTTGTTKVDSGRKNDHQLIYFDASSFTFEDLLRADAELISKSSYWTTYRATMENGNQLVVRRMKKNSFWKEHIALEKVLVLGKLRHTHILAPKAYYYSNDETLYITDYMENGSLASFLHSSEGQKPKPIGWSTRMSIIVGITRGLVYLHTQENIVHGHLTSGNVLLDKNYNPLIADVGLSRLSDDAGPNSPLNHAPELLKFQDANMKTDVYSLGLIMLEILTRKSTDSKKKGINLPAWVMSTIREEWNAQVYDPELIKEESDSNEGLVLMLELAMACVSLSPNARPKAHDVLQQLKEIAAIADEEKEMMV